MRVGAAGGADPSALHSNVVVDDPNEVPLSSAIRKVTVYSDRALVSRQGAVKVAMTPTVYAFRQLPGWVDEGFVVTVENLSNKPVPLQLADRVPVSEDKDITISSVKISPDVKPDSKGILRWPLTVKPKEKQRFEIQYTIEYPPTLVVEMKRSPHAAPPAADEASPSPPAGRKAYDLKTDIEHLEQNF